MVQSYVVKRMELVVKSVFKRNEVKFMLTQEQYLHIKGVIKKYMQEDEFGSYLVQSLYFDTDNWQAIRASIEKPKFKEKLRLRCYGIPTADDIMYLELKKKLRGIVYKRRISFPMALLAHKTPREIALEDDSQIGRELSFYLNTYPVQEKAHVVYNREPFENDQGLRITFDSNLRFCTTKLDYHNPHGGLPILDPHLIIMEVKTQEGIPLWLASELSELKIYPSSFSKYGTGYKKYILQKVN